jgi:hypothetical protein
MRMLRFLPARLFARLVKFGEARLPLRVASNRSCGAEEV